jgi:retinol-binding protein 3
MRLLIMAAVMTAALQTASPPATDAIVRRATEIFAAEYFDARVAESVSGEIRRRFQAGRYADSTTNQDLANRLTADLYELTRDKHVAVRVRRSSTIGSAPPRRDVPTDAGFRRAEILDGNIGLLDIAYFLRPEEHRAALEAAMKKLLHADALILDMRQNSGGSPDTVTLLVSYVADVPGRPLFEIRPRTGAQQTYVTQPVPAEMRNSDRDVYVLTSSHTFSAGEGLAFLLQEMKRGTLVGEVTAGAANPGRGYVIDDTFEIQVPNGKLQTAVSRGNWEGRGVTPDVAAPAVEALRVAHLLAIDRLLESVPSGTKRENLERARERVRRQNLQR